MADLKLDRPNDRLTITFQGQSRELFMSYRRQNNCLRALGDADNLVTLTLNPDMSEAMLKIMLAPTADTSLYDVELGEDDMSMDDIDKTLVWVRDHLAYFFLKRFQQIGQQANQLEPLAGHLRSSLLGSASSISSEPSAGPSTAAPATSGISTTGDPSTT